MTLCKFSIQQGRRLCLLLGIMGLMGLGETHAQTGFPTKPITIVVGFPPGSAPDIAARAYGQSLSMLTKQSVVVDNRPGAGGQIAARFVANSPADGHTLLFGDVGAIAIAPAAYQKLSYSPSKDFKVISEVVANSFALVTSGSGKKTLQEFVANARTPGQRTNMATFGPGTVVHLALEMLADASRFEAVSVHYRNTGELVSAVIAEDVQIAYAALAVAAPQVAAGKMRALAVTSETRSPMLPDTPTLAELGHPSLSVYGWIAAFVPAATPPHAAAALRGLLEQVSNDSALKQQLEPKGFILNRIPASEVEAYVRAETTRWADVVKKTGFRGD